MFVLVFLDKKTVVNNYCMTSKVGGMLSGLAAFLEDSFESNRILLDLVKRIEALEECNCIKKSALKSKLQNKDRFDQMVKIKNALS